MKKWFLIIAMVSSLGAMAMNPIVSTSVHELGCGEYIEKGTTVKIDTLVISCFRTILLQDNAVLEIGHIKWVPNGDADWDDEVLHLYYGDTGWGDNPPQSESEIETLERFDMDGNPYNDYRLVTDVNPLVKFLECMPTGVLADKYVDVEYVEYCPDITLGDEEFVISPENEMDLDAIVWDVNGRVLHEGTFGDIFLGACGVGCLQEQLWNKLLLIEFRTPEGVRIRVKRIYVR